MSWLFSQALVEAYSAEPYLGGGQSAPSKSTLTPLAYLPPDRMTAFSTRSLSGMTYAPLTEDLGVVVLMSFLADFPARTSAQPEKGKESTANGPGSGVKWQGSFTKYDPISCLWRIPQYSLLGDLEEFSETWPRWGSMRNGECWRRRIWARRIKGKESGLWATPAASDGTRGGTITQNMSGQSLPQMVNTLSKWPTPKANDAEKRGNFDITNARNGLPAAVKMWPTPLASDSKGSLGNFRGDGKPKTNLAKEVKVFPTPTANDYRTGYGETEAARLRMEHPRGKPLRDQVSPGGQLNPTWVEWLMGWPLGWTDLKPLATDRCRNAMLRRGND